MRHIPRYALAVIDYSLPLSHIPRGLAKRGLHRFQAFLASEDPNVEMPLIVELLHAELYLQELHSLTIAVTNLTANCHWSG